jgi:hypothetical protein
VQQLVAIGNVCAHWLLPGAVAMLVVFILHLRSAAVDCKETLKPRGAVRPHADAILARNPEVCRFGASDELDGTIQDLSVIQFSIPCYLFDC